MDPLQVKPHEAAGWTAAITALTAFITRLFKVRRATGDSAELRELKAQLESQKERNREQQLQLVLQPINAQLADVLRENGRQAQRLEVLEADCDALGAKYRELASRVATMEPTE